MVMKDRSTATSKRRRTMPEEVPAAMPTHKVDHGGRNHNQRRPPAAATGDAALLWTEEMHSSFLGRMEAAFVHDILFGWPAGYYAADAGHGALHRRRRVMGTMATAEETTSCLDRYVPDSAESTQDGHGDALPAAVSASGIKGKKGVNVGRNGCTAAGAGCPLPSAQADITDLQSRSQIPPTTGSKATGGGRQHPLPGPPEESSDEDGAAAGEQVVPSFRMP